MQSKIYEEDTHHTIETTFKVFKQIWHSGILIKLGFEDLYNIVDIDEFMPYLIDYFWDERERFNLIIKGDDPKNFVNDKMCENIRTLWFCFEAIFWSNIIEYLLKDHSGRYLYIYENFYHHYELNIEGLYIKENDKDIEYIDLKSEYIPGYNICQISNQFLIKTKGLSEFNIRKILTKFDYSYMIMKPSDFIDTYMNDSDKEFYLMYYKNFLKRVEKGSITRRYKHLSGLCNLIKSGSIKYKRDASHERPYKIVTSKCPAVEDIIIPNGKVSYRNYNGSDSNFDMIDVELSVLRRGRDKKTIIDLIRKYKKYIDQIALINIKNSKRWKNLELSTNILKLGNLVYTNQGLLIYTFEIKNNPIPDEYETDDKE